MKHDLLQTIQRYESDSEKINEQFYEIETAIEELDIQFSTDFRKFRSTNKISLRSMAKKLKISAAYLSDIERGKRGISMEFLEKVKQLIANK